MSENRSAGLVLGMVVGVAAGLLLYAVYRRFARERGRSEEFDERQQLLRGYAFQHAFIAMLIYSLVYLFMELAFDLSVMEGGTALMIGTFLGLTVFAVESILRDAFFALNGRPVGYIILLVFVVASNAVSGIMRIKAGDVVVNGKLTSACINLVTAAAFLVVLIAILVHMRRGDDSE